MAYGFFSDDSGLPLPHPPIPWPLLLKIEEAVGAAWGLLRDKPPEGFDLRTAEENEITHKLQTAVFDRVLRDKMVAGFDRLMVGYASTSFELKTTLKDALKHGETEFCVESKPRECRHIERTLFSHEVHISRHRRNFTYVETKVAAPAITLRHLWLPRD